MARPPAAGSPPGGRVVGSRQTVGWPDRVGTVVGPIRRRIASAPRIVLVPAGGVGVLAIVAMVLTLVLRPAEPVTALRSVGATPSPPSHDAVITAFFLQARDPNATFSVKIQGTVSIDRAGKVANEAMAADLQVHGDDLAGTMEVTGTVAPAFSGSVTRVGTQSWVRTTGSATWVPHTLPDTAESLNPFSWISTVDELSYVRTESAADGQRIHVLETSKWLSGLEFDDLILALSDPTRESRMVVQTQDNGVPTSATYTIRIEGRLGASSSTVVLTSATVYTFSGWGESISIRPPI